MAEIKDIATEIQDIVTTSIDPESTVNVRRTLTEESVERVKVSIAEHGFWRNNPIIIRPHPDSSSEYEYEVVVGQCRLRACLELGLERLPAVIEKIDDDAAIRRSWAENEGRSDITPGDKAYWVRRIIEKHRKEGETVTRCREIAAKFFAVSVSTVINYYPMGFLPQKVMKMVDDDELLIQDAEAIAKSAYHLKDPKEADQKMKERAEWITKFEDKPHKDEAVKVLGKLDARASIDELDSAVQQAIEEQTARVEIAIVIPEALHGKLLQWGGQQGLAGADDATIISHMITVTLRGV